MTNSKKTGEVDSVLAVQVQSLDEKSILLQPYIGMR